MKGGRGQANVLFKCFYQPMFLECKFCYESEVHRMQLSHSLHEGCICGMLLQGKQIIKKVLL